ncbi:GAF domain-containing protein [Desulfacinum hydrothermale DSM 13146]|uniref:GAF domain-containing protein n=1 Tax=Desulfacinum hydrothermale DSM 13146 TaxID=1121390 RepID=A0A1W1X1L4_9BACT|nr:GAF domain-containing protein [Desulfacinum hydrothermale]SMC17787.1 GAF domain-containing protein [Desulfacinum hydrothermale DSM 13146]
MSEKERGYLDAFRRVVRVVSATLDVGEVLDLLVRTLPQVLDVKACAVRLLDPKKRTLELVASQGLSEAYVNKGAVDADQSIAEAMEGKIVVVRDAATDSRVQYAEAAKAEGISGICSVPLAVKGRIIGVLRLYTAEARDFDQEEIHFAEALGELAAIAIENARMYERLKKDYEEVMADVFRFVGYRRSL